MTRKTDYQFTAVPTQLFLCLDNNCRSTLFSLIQLSTYYENKNGAAFDGWFFRTNALLEDETNLRKNTLNGALDALYQARIIDIIPQAKGKGKAQGSRKYKVNFDSFLKYQELPFEECSCSHPDYGIVTLDYKNKRPSFQQKLQLEEQTKSGKSDNNKDNIYNTEIKENKDIKNIDNLDINKNTNSLVISNSVSTNQVSFSNSQNPVVEYTKEDEEPRQEKALYQVSSFNSKYGERPRQEEKQGSKESDFLRSITLDDDFDTTPSTPPDERYRNYAETIQDWIRYDAEPNYEEMTDREMMDAAKDAVDDAILCGWREGRNQRFWDYLHRALKIYMHLNGCSEDAAKRGINRLYKQREEILSDS